MILFDQSYESLSAPATTQRDPQNCNHSLRNTPACRSVRHAGRRGQFWDFTEFFKNLVVGYGLSDHKIILVILNKVKNLKN